MSCWNEALNKFKCCYVPPPPIIMRHVCASVRGSAGSQKISSNIRKMSKSLDFFGRFKGENWLLNGIKRKTDFPAWEAVRDDVLMMRHDHKIFLHKFFLMMCENLRGSVLRLFLCSGRSVYIINLCLLYNFFVFSAFATHAWHDCWYNFMGFIGFTEFMPFYCKIFYV